MQEDDKKIDDLKPIKAGYDGYVRYTGIAFQMMAIIGVFTFIGYKIDEWLQLKYPIFTIIFVLLSVFASLYSVVKSLK